MISFNFLITQKDNKCMHGVQVALSLCITKNSNYLNHGKTVAVTQRHCVCFILPAKWAVCHAIKREGWDCLAQFSWLFSVTGACFMRLVRIVMSLHRDKRWWCVHVMAAFKRDRMHGRLDNRLKHSWRGLASSQNVMHLRHTKFYPIIKLKSYYPDS